MLVKMRAFFENLVDLESVKSSNNVKFRMREKAAKVTPRREMSEMMSGSFGSLLLLLPDLPAWLDFSAWLLILCLFLLKILFPN